ncbi:MAG TPA: aminoglycoside phosphotransferase family protein [Solirubrobacteraceae bacterium]
MTVLHALAAARGLAEAHGLPAAGATVLHAGSNVVVHLPPAPVVVRVMSGTAALHADPAQWLAREVSVCAHLARLGAAVVAPSDVLPAGPHHVDGLWMTGWAYVPVDRGAPEPPPDELGHALRELHRALARVPVEVEPLAAVADELAGLIDGVNDPRAAGWRAELAAVAPRALEVRRDAQPIHGDASLSNLLATTDGRRLWADFEDVRCGPVEADVAGVIDAARRRGLGEPYERALLAAYGPVDEELLRAQLRLHALYGDVWRAGAGAPGRP